VQATWLTSHFADDNTNANRTTSTGLAAYGSPRDEVQNNNAEMRLPSIGIPTPQTVPEAGNVDGLATVSSVDDGESLYGASSTIALTRFFRVKTAETLDDSLNATAFTSSETSGPTPGRYCQAPVPELTHDEDVAASLYPSRALADDFVSCFWEFVHPLFPILHKTSFMHRYHLLWSRQETDAGVVKDPAARLDDVIFSSMLNIIFALGCQFSTRVPAQQCMTLAQDLYQRARRLYNYEVMDSMSVPLVQMLLLTGVYLQSAQNANRCWNVIGLAIRVAQGIGLHTERPRVARQTQLDREMRRRVWHCCLVLDR
jgi:hypothetical protein